MGWQIEKDVVYPGRVVVRNPQTGKPLEYRFTPADLAAMHRTGNAKLADGWNIPLVWEHQNELPDKRPMLRLSRTQKDAEFARGVFGCSTQFVLRNVNGQPRLRAVLAGDDPEDLKQFAKVKHVSPEIQWDWMDTEGRVWNGPTITHIAATPRPVQRHQDAVQLSLNRSEIHVFDDLQNFLAGVACVGGRMHPSRIRLSLADYAEAPMADETINPKGSAAERIAAALNSAGFKIGDGKNVKDLDHLADLIEVACMNKDTSDIDDEPPPPEDDDTETQTGGDMDQPPAGAGPAPSPPVQMSQQAQQRLRERSENTERRVYRLDIAELERQRQVTPAVAEDLRAKAKTVRLSMTDAGEFEPNEVSIRIEAYKKNPPGSAWSPSGKRGKVQMSHTKAAPESPYAGDTKTDDEFVKEYEESVGR